jgi:hypothetical protein
MTRILELDAARTTKEIEDSNLRRLEAINAMGIPLAGIDTHHLIELFAVTMEALGLDVRALMASAEHRQQLWLEGELERIESAIRVGMLTAPLAQQKQGV